MSVKAGQAHRLYGPGDVWTKQRLALARRGWRALEGPDEAYFPTIHVDDAARAVAAAISVPSGIYNVTDSVPLTNGQLNAVLASLSGRPRLYPLWPSFHPADHELLARSHRVDSGLFEQSSGWKPLMPSAETGLPSCVLGSQPANPIAPCTYTTPPAGHRQHGPSVTGS